jgi:predicted RNase H-like HicB family nuclease
MMQVYRLKAVVEPDERGVHAWCPALKGCHTWGATVEEALDHLRDAASLYVESLVAHGEPIPIGKQGQRSAAERDLILTV